MKRIEAIFSPGHLEAVHERLRMIGVPGMTVHQLHGLTAQSHEVVYRGVVGKTDLEAKVRVDVVAPDDHVEGILNAILLVVRRLQAQAGPVARGGEDDGFILVTPVDEAIRIRTGETGPDAL